MSEVKPEVKSDGYKAITEKYCPVVGHNVAVEVLRRGYAENAAKCLNGHNCQKERGGCKNSYFGSI